MISSGFVSIPESVSINIVPPPINTPPMKLKKKPFIVTPPLVPGGTFLHGLVKRNGSDFDKIPNSEASVSARQVE
jgi:hypothetical protein